MTKTHVVLNEQNGQTEFLAYPGDHRHEFFGLLRIHAGSRFIEKQQLWFSRQCPGNFQAALRAVRQVFGNLILFFVEFKDLQQLDGLLFNLCLFTKITAQAKHRLQDAVFHMRMIGDFHIIEHAEFGKQADILERPRYAALRDLIRFQAEETLAIKINCPCRRLVDPGQQVKCRRLACTIRANQSDELSFIDIYIKIRATAFRPPNNLETPCALNNSIIFYLL